MFVDSQGKESVLCLLCWLQDNCWRENHCSMCCVPTGEQQLLSTQSVLIALLDACSNLNLQPWDWGLNWSSAVSWFVVCFCLQQSFVVKKGPKSWDEVLVKQTDIHGSCLSESCKGQNPQVSYSGPGWLYDLPVLTCLIRASTQFTALHIEGLRCHPKLCLFLCWGSTQFLYTVWTVDKSSNAEQLSVPPVVWCVIALSDPVLVFPCDDRHAMCVPCFKVYVELALNSHLFERDPRTETYTLGCPGKKQ